MDYKLHRLSSGLKVLVVPMPGLESATVTIWAKTGSRNEEEKVAGISHFLEHMVFKGSEKRPTAKDISQAVDAIGGEFNAGTSKDWTNFYIKAGKENLETAMDVLSDMVLRPLIKSEEIEREKGTIVQEIRMYEDTPMMHIGDVFERVIFANNPLGRDTAGSETTVKSVRRDDFISYRKMHYYPENMLVTVAGGVNESTVLKFVNKYFSQFSVASSPVSDKGLSADRLSGGPETGKLKSENRQLKTHNNIFLPSQTKPQFKLQTKKCEQAHLILGFMSEGRSYESRFAQSLLSVILGGGMSSRMFLEIRERRGLAYSIRTSMERYQEVGYMGTYAGVNVAKIDEAIAIMLEQHYGISNGQFPISNKELAKAKGFLKGNLALALEDTKDVSMFFGEQQLFLDHPLTPEEIFRKVDAVNLDQIYFEAKKLFIPERLNLAIIGPFKDQEKFVQLLK
jgi:predicted Zn-dependent peptidase